MNAFACWVTDADAQRLDRLETCLTSFERHNSWPRHVYATQDFPAVRARLGGLAEVLDRTGDSVPLTRCKLLAEVPDAATMVLMPSDGVTHGSLASLLTRWRTAGFPLALRMETDPRVPVRRMLSAFLGGYAPETLFPNQDRWRNHALLDASLLIAGGAQARHVGMLAVQAYATVASLLNFEEHGLISAVIHDRGVPFLPLDSNAYSVLAERFLSRQQEHPYLDERPVLIQRLPPIPPPFVAPPVKPLPSARSVSLPMATSEAVDDPETVVFDHGAGGIGDGLLGLCVVAKFKKDNPDKRVVYNAGQLAVRQTNSFIGLFQGPDVVGENARCHSEAPVRGARQVNANYSKECIHQDSPKRFSSTFASQSRWQRYARNAGTDGYVIPPLKEPERIKALGHDHAGRVVLCPKSTDPAREWNIRHWLTLEKLLYAGGYRTTILHSARAGLEQFTGNLIADAHAERIAGIMLNAACVVGTDHGLSHLGGILGVQTIVLGGGTPVNRIFDAYPRVTCVQGGLNCSGCCGGVPADASCRRSCANLQAIEPARVFEEVERVWLKETVAGGRSLLATDRLASIRDSVLATNHLGGDVAELGVYQGGSAKLIGTYADGAVLHLFDTFAGIPEDDERGSHVTGEFACSLREVSRFVGNARYWVGWFPASAPSELRFRFAHVDGDTYQTTKAACEYFAPRMVPGGILLWDDYGWKNCPGVAQALHEAFGSRVEHAARYQARVRF